MHYRLSPTSGGDARTLFNTFYSKLEEGLWAKRRKRERGDYSSLCNNGKETKSQVRCDQYKEAGNLVYFNPKK
jgi:hypothetical protein